MLKRFIKRSKSYLVLTLSIFSSCAFALDPETKAAQKVHSILFGSFGLSVCAIILGATFLLAKTGKITWDKFLFILLCTAGFFGSPAIVSTIQGWVS